MLAKTIHHGGGGQMTDAEAAQALAVIGGYITIALIVWVAVATYAYRRYPSNDRSDAFMIGFGVGFFWPAAPFVYAAWRVFVKLTTTKEKQP